MSDTQSSALVGHTGFVGSNLLRQRAFDACFNSKNIEQIDGRGFDLLVVSGAPAEKWKANADPARDRDNIERLIRAIDRVAYAQKVVLISTVDVFINPVDVDEDSPVPLTGLHAYGRNRRLLEEVLSARFDTVVLRLAGLYGHGLKKNAIHDLLHDHEVYKIDSRGSFQFYDIDRLWRDAETAIANALPLAHLPTEPVSVADVARAAFGMEFTNEVVPVPARYDVHTRHAALFGGDGVYVESKIEELAGIQRFVERERRDLGSLSS